MDKIITDIRKELRANVDEKTKSTAQRFFKEEVKFYGAKASVVTEIAKRYFRKVEGRNKKDIFALCEELFQSGISEESWIAASWADSIRDRFTAGDFRIFQRWINAYVSNWASCDTLCNHAVGDFIEMYPACMVKLKKWTASSNRWMRRAAAVSLVLPARKGKFLEDVLEIAGMLLEDKDDMVQKGYGWMLKEASRKHEKEIFGFIMENKSRMPRTALRYAIEKMPENLRKKAMQK